MELTPTVSVVVEIVALLPLSVAVPNVVEPLLNVTVPVGVPDWLAVTVAVNVTVCINAEGFAEDARVVVVKPPGYGLF